MKALKLIEIKANEKVFLDYRLKGEPVAQAIEGPVNIIVLSEQEEAAAGTATSDSEEGQYCQEDPKHYQFSEQDHNIQRGIDLVGKEGVPGGRRDFAVSKEPQDSHS